MSSSASSSSQGPLPGKISLIIPAHNEELNIGSLVTQSCEVLPQIASSFEIIIVDDGSTDRTTEVATHHMDPHAPGQLRIIRHREKMGYGITVGDGLRASTGDLIAFIDGDGQFDVHDLRHLAEHLGEADFVTGRRANRADNWKRKLTSGVFNILVKLLYRIHYDDVDCALKLMRRNFLDDALPLVSRSALLNTELYIKARRTHHRVVQVTIPHYPRTAGVHSGGRLIPILRAIRELIMLRWKMRLQ
ncbi:MAG: glycosyltransferase family 2 protein [Candidatus Dormibacteria bacterium]